jgi:predicted anti-sigma-YlaC factor YlaD
MRLDRELTCAEVVEVITDYLEDRMPLRNRERFEEHVAFCDGCSAYFDQMRATIRATGELRAEDIPSALEERLLAVFREWRPA